MSEETQNTQSGLATKQIIEGLLMAAGKPLPMNKIAEVFPEKERPQPDELKAALREIEEDCQARGFELKQVASGYRFQVKQEYSEWVGKLWEEKPQRYSRALLETISIIAYRQPITRGEIEKIRGVAVSTNIIRTLMERDWVRVVGHRDVPGRPAMYATTREFLDYFNLKSLEELPPLTDVKELEDLEPDLPLDDVVPESRVLEFPTAEEIEDDFDVPDEEEEMAAAIGTRPIEEILGIQEEEEPEEDWDDDDDDGPLAARAAEDGATGTTSTGAEDAGVEAGDANSEADAEDGADTPDDTTEDDADNDDSDNDDSDDDTDNDDKPSA